MQVRELVLSTLAVAAMLTAGAAAAQYQWRDERGAMTFSDRPPPASVRPGDVVRHPAMPAARGVPGGATRPGAEPATGAPGPVDKPGNSAPTAADRELAFRKRQLDRAQAERKHAENAERLEQQARACEQARAHQRTLESGMRLAEVDARGEREFLSDQARTQRLGALRRDLLEHCKAG